jgi:transcription elongation factor Elf1
MKNNIYEANLFCDVCGKETLHKITYANDMIEHIVCSECEHGVTLDKDEVLKHYNNDLIMRVLTKPTRMTEEMQADLKGFLKSMPVRLFSKPYRMMLEYKKINEEHS